MIRLVRTIIFTSLIIEFVGFAINLIVFLPKFPILEAIGISVFHVISSFNNAGFDILGSTSLIAYADDVLLNINTMVMITLGGIGFIVIHDVVRKHNWKDLTLYSKIVLKTSLILIVGGMLLIKLFEWNNVTWLQALFQSITCRTAGFSTTDMSLLSDATTLVIMLLMFIGASPNSTGGGVKTTTAYTIYKSITSFLTGKPTIIRNRKIDEETKNKAFALVILSAFSIFVVFLALSSIESKNPASNSTFLNILFETISAFGTVGLSRGLTPELLGGSKIIISALMFLGRLGPITIFGIWNKNWGHPYISSVDYASEKILIG
jgi:trk system potassium uptake protein TrkH